MRKVGNEIELFSYVCRCKMHFNLILCVCMVNNFRECDIFWNFLKSFSGQVYFIALILFPLASEVSV